MKMSPPSSVRIGLVVSIIVELMVASAGQILEENLIERDDQVHPGIPYLNDFISNNEINRSRRQDSTSTTTTPRPKKRRPSNIFDLLSVLVTETREDANRAFNEIGFLFNSQFVNGTTTTTTTTTPPPSNSTEASDEDEDVASSTEPFRITRNEFFGVLRSNVQGLVQLFGKEFRVALQDSNKNVKEFGRGLKNAIWPYFTQPMASQNSTS